MKDVVAKEDGVGTSISSITDGEFRIAGATPIQGHVLGDFASLRQSNLFLIEARLSILDHPGQSGPALHQKPPKPGFQFA